jgi:hypothetical protein
VQAPASPLPGNGAQGYHPFSSTVWHVCLQFVCRGCCCAVHTGRCWSGLSADPGLDVHLYVCPSVCSTAADAAATSVGMKPWCCVSNDRSVCLLGQPLRRQSACSELVPWPASRADKKSKRRSRAGPLLEDAIQPDGQQSLGVVQSTGWTDPMDAGMQVYRERGAIWQRDGQHV